MNDLLKWSVENTVPSDPNSGAPASDRALDPEALQRLLSNAPSDADLMKHAMAAIRDPDISLDNKLIAFDNFEQLVETIDNANNLEVLGLWTPLLEELSAPEAERRKYAAWCIGTAVQNNEKAQERLLVLNEGISTLVRLSQTDPDSNVRRKAAYAISSAVRNYQPGMDELRRHLPKHIVAADEKKIEAGDMDRIDEIMAKIRES